MLRVILSVIVGYVVIAVIVILASSVAFVAPGFAFESGTSKVTMVWCIYELVTGFLAAMAGGWTAQKLSPPESRSAVRALAGLCLCIGLAMGIANAVQQLGSQTSNADPTNQASEKLENAVQPVWFGLTMPLVGSIGVLVGARERKSVGANRGVMHAT